MPYRDSSTEELLDMLASALTSPHEWGCLRQPCLAELRRRKVLSTTPTIVLIEGLRRLYDTSSPVSGCPSSRCH